MSGVFDELWKHSVTLRVSREMALDAGLVQPTDAERVDRAARAARYREWKARRDAQESAMLETLRGKDDPVTVAMLALHAPRQDSASADCAGCEYQGYEAEPIEWPCATVYRLAQVHGIPTPEGYQP